MNTAAFNLSPNEPAETHTAPIEVTLTHFEYDEYLRQKTWSEALERCSTTIPDSEMSAIMGASLGTVGDIDKFLVEHPTTNQEAQYFLGISRASKVMHATEAKTEDIAAPVALRGSQAQEYQDHDLYMKGIDMLAKVADSKAKWDIWSLRRAGEGEKLAAYQREHWAKLTPAEAELIESELLLISRGVNGQKYTWATHWAGRKLAVSQ